MNGYECLCLQAELGMNRAVFAARHCVSLSHRVSLRRALSSRVPCLQVMTNPGDIASLYRQLSRFPSLSRADVGPVVTSQYGGKYSNIYTGVQVTLLLLCFWGAFKKCKQCARLKEVPGGSGWVPPPPINP